MANLTSLPQETISQIALCLDRHSGLSLALTCRAFAGPAEARLWQTLELSLSPYYGVSPPIQPHEGAFPLAERGGAFLLRHRPYTALEAWAWNQVETAEEAYRTALPGIIDRIIRMADGRRWALVREITAAPRVGAIAGIVRVLRNAAPRLAELHLDEPTSLDALAPIFPADIDTLDYALIRADLHFPFLTYLRLGHDSVRFSDLILLFLHAAPNLTDRDFDTWGLWDLPADAETQMPQLQGETKLRRLKMEFADRGRQEETDESSPVLEMLRRSPLVEQLSEGYMDQNVVVYDGLVKTAWTMRGLRDYHWRWEPSDFMDSVVYTMGELETPGFTGLKRLVYSHASFDYMFTALPPFPSIQVVYINPIAGGDGGHKFDDLILPASNPSLRFPERPRAQGMIPSFAAALKACNLLTTYRACPDSQGDVGLGFWAQLDEMEKSDDNIIGCIRSFTHGGSEVLHARLLMSVLEVRDFPRPDPDDTHLLGWRRVHYPAADGTERVKVFEANSGSAWYDYTDYEGYVVQLEVFDKMRRVQGAAPEDWQGRGIEVGEAAWKVLTAANADYLAKKSRLERLLGKPRRR